MIILCATLWSRPFSILMKYTSCTIRDYRQD